jgi:hypothetical protein
MCSIMWVVFPDRHETKGTEFDVLFNCIAISQFSVQLFSIF